MKLLHRPVSILVSEDSGADQAKEEATSGNRA